MTWILLGTAAYVAIVVYGSGQLLLSASAMPLPARYASLPAVLILFGPPTYLLGFISPYAAELSEKKGIGEASGTSTRSALSAASSVRVRRRISSFRRSASHDRAPVRAPSRRNCVRAHAPRPLPRPAGVYDRALARRRGWLGPVAFDHRGDVVYQTQTAYQELEVIDDGDVRTLYLDDARHSAMDLDDPDRHVFSTRYFHLPMLMVDDPDEVENVLFIGGEGIPGQRTLNGNTTSTSTSPNSIPR